MKKQKRVNQLRLMKLKMWVLTSCGLAKTEYALTKTCTCGKRCKTCGYGIHGVAHTLPKTHPLYHKYQPKN